MVFQIKNQIDHDAISLIFKNYVNQDAENLIMEVEKELTDDVMKQLEGKKVSIYGSIPVELGIFLGYVLKKVCGHIEYNNTFCV
jgi:hypothetical protein